MSIVENITVDEVLAPEGDRVLVVAFSSIKVGIVALNHIKIHCNYLLCEVLSLFLRNIY